MSVLLSKLRIVLIAVAAVNVGILAAEHPARAATCTPGVGPGIPPPANVPTGIDGFHASWYGQSGYPTLCPGGRSTATVAYYNSGSRGWVANRMGEMAFLGTWEPSPGQDKPSALGGDGTNGSPATGWPRYNRVAAQPAAYVGPNQVAWFQFEIVAPSAPGTYKLYIRPLIEGATWMEDFGVYWQVTVKTTDPEYGLLTRRSETVVIRTEADPAPIRTFAEPSAGAGFTRSHDGRRLAYWTEIGGTTELHVLVLPSTDTVVARFPSRRPGAIAWAVADSGLLVSVAELRSDNFLIPRIVMAVDLASGQTREVYRGTGPSGASVIPLVWRPSSPETFAVYETGPGGFHFGYTVIRPGFATMKWEPDGRVSGMQASADGGRVLGLWLDLNAIRVWPTENFPSQVEFAVSPQERIAQPGWWPDLTEVVFIRGRQDGGIFTDSRIERWNPVTGGRIVVRQLAPSNVLGGYLVRGDGSGVLARRSDGGWEVTDFASGNTNAVPTVSGEFFLDSLMLQ